MLKDFVTQLSGFLVALLGFFTAVGIKFEWFTLDSINAFVLVVSAFLALLINIYSVWKNTYTSKKAQIQKLALQKQGLIKK